MHTRWSVNPDLDALSINQSPSPRGRALFCTLSCVSVRISFMLLLDCDAGLALVVFARDDGRDLNVSCFLPCSRVACCLRSRPATSPHRKDYSKNKVTLKCSMRVKTLAASQL